MSNVGNAKIIELLASKICHDLISPIGAISNGIEIMEELGGDDNCDITKLLSFSATQANAKLKAMRLAYGAGGTDPNIKINDIYNIFEDYISGENRISQDWNPNEKFNIDDKIGFAKSLMLLLLFAVDTLPKGGIISVKPYDHNSILINAKGENAHFRDNYLHALEHNISSSDLDPKLIHPYITGLLTKNYGFKIDVEKIENNFISLRLKYTDVS